MLVRCRQMDGRQPRVLRAAFTLIEVLMCVTILALVMAGVIYGYAQTNRFAEWSSMSLAAQSYALQGLEQVRSAKWDLQANPKIDYLPAPSDGSTISYAPQSDYMDVPATGAPFTVTNCISLKRINPGSAPQLRQVTSVCYWKFPRTGQVYSNTVITYRAPDHQ